MAKWRLFKQKIGNLPVYKILALSVTLFLSGCSTLKVVELDEKTGFFPGSKRAEVTVSLEVDLDAESKTVLVSNGDFTGNMVKNIGYFDEVINFTELETIIIKNNLTDAVPSINDRIGINKAAKAYKPFFWLRWDSRKEGRQEYSQLILTNPLTLEDYFVAETFLDTMVSGVNDYNNFYPMMNSLIEYLKENSDEFR